MVRCPVCTKIQLVYVQGLTGTSCYYCGARWIQEGAEQGGIIGLESPRSAMRTVGQVQAATEETR